jgi:hypothetical protein
MKATGWIIVLTILLVVSCAGKDYSGTHVGYSWQSEAKGTTLEEATQKIETTLTLDKKGTILDAKMNFLVKAKDGTWFARNDTSAEVAVDFAVDPKPAELSNDGKDYKAGVSMFKIKTADMMSFYAVAAGPDGTTALAIVEPFTRYQFEIKMEPGFDFAKPIKDMTVGSGFLVPTIRASSGGYLVVKNRQDLADKHLFAFYRDPYVLTGRGVLKGLTPDSTMKELLEKTGVTFRDGKPQPTEVKYGFSSNGGWAGNYKAVGEFLKGKDATKLTSLIDWKNPRYAGAINKDNFFGVDAKSGATKTVQNSVDGIAGATVRMSREATSYQRALVKAGILKEKDVIKGRF